MFHTASVANFDESFKQDAANKRSEFLKILEEKLSKAFFEQCKEYFRNQTNLILAETETEVKAYLKQLEDEESRLFLKMGLLAFVPIVGLYAPFGYSCGVDQSCKSGRAFPVGFGPGSGLKLTKISVLIRA